MKAPRIAQLVTTGEWMMTPGERAAIEGILAVVRPALSIEIGTWSGGSLERIAAHSTRVHAFDTKRHPRVTDERFPNVAFHLGDSHELLPEVLDELAKAGENVDFALVDGDHSADGVRRDLEDLLASPSAGETVIVLHDTLNARVRTGLEQVDFAAHEKVRFVDLDFVQGCVMREDPQENDLWYGLGIVVTGPALEGEPWPRPYAAPDVYRAFSESLVEHGRPEQALGHDQLVELEQEVELRKELVRQMERSLSWRVTAPLRRAKGLARRARR